MIRINLLGQARPKTAKQSVPLESTLQIILGIAAVAIALIVLGVMYSSQKRELDETNAHIAQLKAERAQLQQIIGGTEARMLKHAQRAPSTRVLEARLQGKHFPQAE